MNDENNNSLPKKNKGGRPKGSHQKYSGKEIMSTVEDTLFTILYPNVARELNALGFMSSDLPSESPVTWPQAIADWCIWTRHNFGPFLTAYCEDIPLKMAEIIELGEPQGTLTIHGAQVNRTIMFRGTITNLRIKDCRLVA